MPWTATVRAALCVLLLPGMACARQNAERRFSEQVAAVLRPALPRTAVVTVTEDLQLVVTGEGDNRHELNLDNVWRECRGEFEGCPSVDRFVRMAVQAHADDDATPGREKVRALVKDGEWVRDVSARIAAGPRGEDNALVMRPLLGDLWVVYAFDLPDGIQMMSRASLKALGLDEERVHALAVANLDALGDIPHRPHEEEPAVRVVHVGDSYDASRLLVLPRWAAPARSVRGSLVAVAPTRDFVFFTGSADAAALARMKELAHRAMAEEGHPLAATLLRWTPEGWVLHEAPARDSR